MRFCSYIKKLNQKTSWGIAVGSSRIADLSLLAPDIRAFLEHDGINRLPEITKILDRSPTLGLEEIELLACLPNPASIRDGYAFRQHVEAARKNRNLPMIPEYDAFPVFYFGDHRSITGPGDVKVQKLHTEALDFELEIGVVIGKKGKNIPAEKADDYIFGYTIWNDWSARALQFQEMKLSMGPMKGKDFANSFGPWLITRDELAAKKIPSPKGERYELAMKATLNGEQVSAGNAKDMTFTFAQIIERASYGTYIYPGDVFGSGTVGSGCFMEKNGYAGAGPWLKVGDELTLEVESLGQLTNKIVLAKEDWE